jgi:uncharacterized membrane protein YraQ (UPF0718 family)
MIYTVLNFLSVVLVESWELLRESSVFILFGLLVAGLLKMFLSTQYVARHLGEGRFSSVFKAALFGIPIPLCSCGVLPAAASLKKQGANNGATTAFLISTPESGVDSISITYALIDPIMTVARPLVAFVTAMTAGVLENLIDPPGLTKGRNENGACPVDNCCSGEDCEPEDHASHHTFAEKFRAGIRYAGVDLWGDLAGWFVAGLLLAGVISALIPDALIGSYLGGGLFSMLLMLVVGVPLYICATASTPIAAAMILKGVSPGAALVFLLVGPATNMASLSVLLGFLGKRATAIYLAAISIVSVVSGLLLDVFYHQADVDPRAVVGQAAEIVPTSVQIIGALFLAVLSVKPMLRIISGWKSRFWRVSKVASPVDGECSGSCSTG